MELNKSTKATQVTQQLNDAIDAIEIICDNNVPGIIAWPEGSGKTYLVSKYLIAKYINYKVFKYENIKQFTNLLYSNKDNHKRLVIEGCDELIASEDGITMLKTLLDSNTVEANDDNIPNRFTYPSDSLILLINSPAENIAATLNHKIMVSSLDY